MTLSRPRDWRLPLFLLSAFIILLDRLTKNWVTDHIQLGNAITVIPRVFRISHVLNEGAAFSLFADSLSPERVRWMLVAFSAIAAVVVLVILATNGPQIDADNAGTGADFRRRDWRSL